MALKSKIVQKIQALQARANAICRICPDGRSGNCRGAHCVEIIRIVGEIDPLVTEFFRIELTEKRRLARLKQAPPVWQRLLPLEFPSGYALSPEEAGSAFPDEIELSSLPEVLPEPGLPLQPLYEGGIGYKLLELHCFREELPVREKGSRAARLRRGRLRIQRAKGRGIRLRVAGSKE